MDYGITEQQKNKIIERWGNGFYLKYLENFDLYSEKWKLVDFQFSDDYGHHIIFYCKSELYGDCVLKMYDDDELVVEYNTLLEYNGKRYVKALGYEPGDHSWGAMLTERVFPGNRLIDEPSLEKRLEIYSELFNGMYIEPKNLEIYYSYTKWITDNGRFGEDISKRENKVFYPYALKAKEIYLEMASVYAQKLLLHGNLHSYNIISCGNGEYKTANPAGVIGDPVFETGMFIFGECCWYGKNISEPEKAETIIDYLEKSLHIPDKVLRQSFYITAVMSDWNIIDRIKFAENVLNNGK